MNEPDASATTTDRYVSSATIPEIADRLRRAENVALLTHSKPDGDAIGSTLAIARTLARIDIDATPVYLPPWLRRIEPLIGSTRVIHESRRCWDKPPISKADTVLVVDTGTWSQVADARKWLESRSDKTIIIDHHAHGDPEMAAVRYVDVDAAAASQIVADLCVLLLGVDSPRDLPTDIAEPLYVGLATDTGWFRYSNTSAAALRLAADLIDAGAEHSRLYTMIEQGDTPNRLRLIQRALATLELFAGGRAAIMTITRRDIEECQAQQDELGGLTDLPQSIATVRVVGVITELNSEITKVSLRSKPPDDSNPLVDVNLVARRLGGGGHVHAAGAKLNLPLEEAHAEIVAALLGSLDQ